MLKVNELFSGIGSQKAALERLHIPHEVVGIAEIDKYAIMSYEAIHGAVRNYGDISKIEKLDYADFWTYSFPCQDISIAGRQRGINEHTRSGLLYQVERLLEVAKTQGELPKYLMLENVKNLVGKKFKAQFDEWIQKLDQIGFNTYWKVLNSKNYGVPQNRERVFAISIRKDIGTGYQFPDEFNSGLKLRDILEKEVDEKYYVSEQILKRFVLTDNSFKKNVVGTTKKNVESIGQKDQVYQVNGIIGALLASDYKHPKQILEESKIHRVGNLDIQGWYDQAKRVYGSTGVAPTLTTNGNAVPKVMIPQATKKGFIECNLPGIADLSYPNSKTRRGRVQNDGDICPTLMAGTQDICYFEVSENNDISNPFYFRIRKLTPLECWRLMGFTDKQFYKAQKVNSNTQLYKQAGNSIVVDVLYYMFKNLFK